MCIIIIIQDAFILTFLLARPQPQYNVESHLRIPPTKKKSLQ